MGGTPSREEVRTGTGEVCTRTGEDGGAVRWCDAAAMVRASAASRADWFGRGTDTYGGCSNCGLVNVRTPVSSSTRNVTMPARSKKSRGKTTVGQRRRLSERERRRFFFFGMSSGAGSENVEDMAGTGATGEPGIVPAAANAGLPTGDELPGAAGGLATAGEDGFSTVAGAAGGLGRAGVAGPAVGGAATGAAGGLATDGMSGAAVGAAGGLAMAAGSGAAVAAGGPDTGGVAGAGGGGGAAGGADEVGKKPIPAEGTAGGSGF